MYRFLRVLVLGIVAALGGIAVAEGANLLINITLPDNSVVVSEEGLSAFVGKDLLCDVAGISKDMGFWPSLGGTAYASGGGSRASVGRMWRSFNTNPGEWELKAAHVEAGNYEGVSIQERWVNRSTGEQLWIHKATNAKGEMFDGPHPRGYFFDQDGGYSGKPRSRW